MKKFKEVPTKSEPTRSVHYCILVKSRDNLGPGEMRLFGVIRKRNKLTELPERVSTRSSDNNMSVLAVCTLRPNHIIYIDIIFTNFQQIPF